MLWDADRVESVVREAAPGLADRALWLLTPTVGVDGARRLAALRPPRPHTVNGQGEPTA
jgi:hypothetical protein